MNYHPSRLLTSMESRKRKDREGFHPSTLAKPLTKPTAVTYGVSGSNQGSNKVAEHPPPITSNRLLAGYMAYEFLTKGSLLGQNFDKARSEAIPVVGSGELRKLKQSRNQPTTVANGNSKPKPHVYPEVAHVLKSDDVHIPGVVNPTQLARWIQM